MKKLSSFFTIILFLIPVFAYGQMGIGGHGPTYGGDPAKPGTVSELKLDHTVEVLNAHRTVLVTDTPILRFDANSTDRNVLLPTEATSTDLVFFIYNMSGELGEDLKVQDDAGADLHTIHYSHFGICTCDGTTWVVRCISCTEATDTLNLRVKEENTSAIVTGQACYISGATGAAFANVGLADCDDSSKIRVKGLASEDISQNTSGYIRVKGLLESVNSTKGSPVNPLSEDWTAHDQLWVSATAGGLTNVRPVGRSIKAGTALSVIDLWVTGGDGCDYWTIQNNIIEYGTKKGIRVVSSTNNIITKNTIKDIGSPNSAFSPQGIQLDAESDNGANGSNNNTITENLIDTVVDNGFYVWDSDLNIIARNKILNITNYQSVYVYDSDSNEIYNNIGEGGVSGGGIYLLDGSLTNKIYGNTLLPHDGYYGISLQNNSTGTLIKNNIFYGSVGLKVESGSETNVDIDYNSYYRASGNLVDWTGTLYTAATWAAYLAASSQDTNSPTPPTNPLFTNAGADDFTLAPGSPCRHGAVYISGYTTKLRPEASWPDNVVTMDDILSIGAYGIYRGSAGY